MGKNYFGYRFRAWDASEQKMYYPDELEQLEGIWYEENPDGTFVHRSSSKKLHRKWSDGILRFALCNGDWENRRTFTVMLSTGDTDITGKEIWELDKVNGRGALNSLQDCTVKKYNFAFSAVGNGESPSATGLANGNAFQLIVDGNTLSEPDGRQEFETSSSGGCSVGGLATTSYSTVNYDQEITDLSPWYRWTFNSTLNDDGYGTSSTPRNGTGSGGISYTSGGGIIPNVSWECIDLTPNDEVRIADSPKINSGTGYTFVKRSISVWAEFDSVSGTTGNGRVIWEQGGGTNWWSIYVYDSDVYTCIGEGRNQKGHCSSSVSTSTLYLITATIDLSLSSNQMKLYINGSLADQATTSAGSSLASHSGNIAWGGPNSSPRNHLNQSITANVDARLADGCYWYEQVLTPTEISNIWSAGN